MPVFQLNGILKTLCTSKSAKYKANSDNINITNNSIINCKQFLRRTGAVVNCDKTCLS